MIWWTAEGKFAKDWYTRPPAGREGGEVSVNFHGNEFCDSERSSWEGFTTTPGYGICIGHDTAGRTASKGDG